jgi:UDP-N-acetylglucosamine--N-acetylmuramyl-(pentapeptide) pyrophosphoryl-undecaprenol N-acetylglucosamine transferase
MSVHRESVRQFERLIEHAGQRAADHRYRRRYRRSYIASDCINRRDRKIVVDEESDLTLNVLYIGSETGLEVRLSKESNILFKSIATGKLRRSANPLKMLNIRNFIDAFRIPLGFCQALKEVNRFRPDVVFSTGGYVSVPAVFAAWCMRVPVLVHEQTVQIGLANRWSAHVSTAIALSFPESSEELNPRDRQKTFVTGGVVRPIVLSGDPERARERYGFVGDIGGLPVVYVTGGAQGSTLINMAVRDALAELTSQCCIIHQCGKQAVGKVQDYDLLLAAAKSLPETMRKRYYVTPYVGDEIGDIYALVDLVIGRSGAGTVMEACATGRAALYIPLVPTGGDEQTKNARRLEDLGAAVSIKQVDLTGSLLSETVSKLVGDRKRLADMGNRARSQFRPDATAKLAHAVIDLGLRRQAAQGQIQMDFGKK